jgi:16S rRNA (uracil1498-N3)-methyltransferase
MRRVFIVGECASRDRVTLTGREAHYVLRVLRLARGDRFSAVLPGGVERIASVCETADERVEALLGEEVGRGADPQVDVRLLPGLVKSAKLELIIQKCTEVGVSSILPVACRRSVPRPRSEDMDKRLARWRRIAEEAARQCGRTAAPEVAAPVSFRAAVTQSAEWGGSCLMMSPEVSGEPTSASSALAQHAAGPISVLVGPEGGFAPEEAEEAVAAGFRVVSLGKRTLRAETAAIVACAIVMHEVGELD